MFVAGSERVRGGHEQLRAVVGLEPVSARSRQLQQRGTSASDDGGGGGGAVGGVRGGGATSRGGVEGQGANRGALVEADPGTSPGECHPVLPTVNRLLHGGFAYHFVQ